MGRAGVDKGGVFFWEAVGGIGVFGVGDRG